MSIRRIISDPVFFMEKCVLGPSPLPAPHSLLPTWSAAAFLVIGGVCSITLLPRRGVFHPASSVPGPSTQHLSSVSMFWVRQFSWDFSAPWVPRDFTLSASHCLGTEKALFSIERIMK